MHCFSNKFSIFNIGDLTLCDLAKLWFFKLIMTTSNLKYQLWRRFSDVQWWT